MDVFIGYNSQYGLRVLVAYTSNKNFGRKQIKKSGALVRARPGAPDNYNQFILKFRPFHPPVQQAQEHDEPRLRQ